MGLVFIHGSLTALKSNPMNNRNRIFLMGCLLLFAVTGCKKSLDNKPFNKPTKIYDIAVEGGYNTRTSVQYIQLSKPASTKEAVPQPISKAVVTLNDGKSNIVFRESATPGIYMGMSVNDPNYNGAYTLTIKYNDKTYTAVDTLRQVVNIVDDFLPLSIKLQTNGLYNGTIPKHTFGYLNPNKWMISYLDLPTWNPAKFDQAKYYSYTHSLGSPNSLYPLNNLKRTFTLSKDDNIFIYKFSLSERYAKYLYDVFMETDWSGLFSGVPSNATGNVSGNAQGYFYAIDVDFRRYKTSEL